MVGILFGQLGTARVVGVAGGLILGIGKRSELSQRSVGKTGDGGDAIGGRLATATGIESNRGKFAFGIGLLDRVACLIIDRAVLVRASPLTLSLSPMMPRAKYLTWGSHRVAALGRGDW